MKALTAEEMREVDKQTTARFGISGAQLMEAAGRVVSDVILRELDGGSFEALRKGVRALILCGKGNNGGDGLVVARHLKVAGIEAEVYLFGDPSKMAGDAGENFQRWRNSGGAVQAVDSERSWEKVFPAVAVSHVIVDALLGTGLHGPVTGVVARAITDLNELSRNATAVRPSLIVAVDMPSGLPSDGEAADGPVLSAHRTVTFTAPKIGQLVSPDAAAGGAMEVRQIGSPAELVEEIGKASVRWTSVEEFAGLPLVRAADSNK